MNIFLFETKRGLKSVLIWTVSMSAAVFIFVQMLPAFLDQASEFSKYLEGYDKLLEIFGVSADSFTTATGYFAYLMTYMSICAAVFGMSAGMLTFSAEFRLKTSDFLLTKPVKRTEVFVAKIGSVAVRAILLDVLFAMFSYAALSLQAEVNLAAFVLMMLAMVILQFNFVFMGVLLSVVMRKIKAVMPITMGITFGFFILTAMERVFDKEFITYILPFSQFDFNEILADTSLDLLHTLACLGFTIISGILAWLMFVKKDIHAV